MCPFGLYAEQLSGTAFTLPRDGNFRTWLYKIKPSVAQGLLNPVDAEKYKNLVSDFADKRNCKPVAKQLRWRPIPETSTSATFLEGIFTYCGAGSPDVKNGIAIHGYSCNKSMTNEAFYSSDGDFLIVPQNGVLKVTTEMGRLTVAPKEICVVPRGIKFRVAVDGQSSGWIAEVYKGHFRIPDLGPIGANGLANPRDFEIPTAAYEESEGEFRLINKYCGEFFEAKSQNSPFDVVAWHGNYYPFKYNLAHFNTMNSVTFDHPDPSIFTVLTAQTDEKGVAVCDFVIFSPRWMVTEHTFRPPYYHRNTMSEFMGNVEGQYDAKGLGFGPGCSSLHMTMTAHGPDGEAFEKGAFGDLVPVKYQNTLSFMFETCYLVKIANPGLDNVVKIDEEYNKCWESLKSNFKGPA